MEPSSKFKKLGKLWRKMQFDTVFVTKLVWKYPGNAIKYP